MTGRDTKPEKRRVNLWIGADLYAELEAEAAEIGVKVPALLKIAARAWCRPRHSGVSPRCRWRHLPPLTLPPL